MTYVVTIACPDGTEISVERETLAAAMEEAMRAAQYVRWTAACPSLTSQAMQRGGSRLQTPEPGLQTEQQQ